jgi:chaperone BCS1
MSVLDIVVASTVSATIAALFISALKRFLLTLPMKLWSYLLKKVTLTVRFGNCDPGFDMLKEWLAAHPYAKKARDVKMEYSQAEGRFVLVPGHGSHFLWFNGPLWIRFAEAPVAPGRVSYGGYKEESYSVTMLAMQHAKMQAFMSELSQFKKKEVSALSVYTWRGGYWSWSGHKRKRSLDTVYMPAKTLADIIKVIKDFLANEEWYAARGIPYRIGILFEGGPGTGKTTLSTALAGYFDKTLYSMNLASIGSDESLQYSFSSANRDGIILIEDVDGFKAAQDRGNIEREESPGSVVAAPGHQSGTKSAAPPEAATPGTLTTANGEKLQQVTISGLLNAIDGVAATEGRILIMTTNDITKLDPALLRSGRVDHKFTIGHLEADDVVNMFKCFYPTGHDYIPAIRRYANARSTTAAAWQKLFIKYHDSVEALNTEVLGQ